MTILSAQSIERLCANSRPIIDASQGVLVNVEQTPMITPFTARGVFNGRSFGLSSAGYDIRLDTIRTGVNDLAESVRMYPGEFYLASTIERIVMPKNVIAFVKDKSSWAREGLAVQNTVLEPGWEGYITLELSYHKHYGNIRVERGDPIAQIVFQWLDYTTQQPYTGKYQNQPNEPVTAKLETESVNK